MANNPEMEDQGRVVHEKQIDEARGQLVQQNSSADIISKLEAARVPVGRYIASKT